MDNGNTFLDLADDTSDLFGSQNDSSGQMFNWADEFLGENEMDLSGSVATESGNLTTNTASNLFLTSSNYAATSSIPAQTVSIANSFLQNTSLHAAPPEQPSTVMPVQSGLTSQIVQQGNQQFILKTANGNQIQLTPQQLQQHLLQQQSNTTPTLQQTSVPPPTVMNRSATPNTGQLSSLSYAGLNPSQFQSTASAAPNVNIVHLPGNLAQQQQQIQQQQHPIHQQAPPTQQVQIAPGTFLQIPGGIQNLGNTGLVQGQPTIVGGQQGSLMNSQNTVIQNPNVVNVNVATHQAVLCSSPAQQQQQQRFTQNPFNIQGTLIQTAEGKSILIPSQNLVQPINIQPWSVSQPVGQAQTQNPNIQLAQSQPNTAQDAGQNQGVQQIVVNNQGQQILVQRAPTPSSQPILVRTSTGQSGLVQIHPRSAQNSAVQAFSNMGTNQQLKIVPQATQSQTGIPMINIGGQNISLQQLSGQLAGNIQGLQVIQQQDTQTQQSNSLTLTSQGQAFQQGQQGQGQITLQQLPNSQGQLSLQGHTLMNKTSQMMPQGRSTTPVQVTQGRVALQPEQIIMQQKSASDRSMQSLGNVAMHQQNQLNSQLGMSNPPNQVMSVTNQTSQVNKDSARDLQTQLLLRQIQQTLKMSQSNDSMISAADSSTQNTNFMVVRQDNLDKGQIPASSIHSQLGLKMNKSNNPLLSTVVSSSQTNVPNVNLRVVKQETMDKMQFSTNTTQSNQISFPFQTSSIKKEPDLIESLVKQEVPYSAVTTTQYSTDISTVSQSNPMSLFTLGSSASVISSSEQSMSSQSFIDSSSVNNVGVSSDIRSSSPRTVTSVSEARPSATVQTIHLPPELQHQFQRVQLEMKKVNMAGNLTVEQKQSKLRQLQVFQKKILLKGRVLATTRAEPHHIQQGLAALSQTASNPSGLSHAGTTSSSTNQTPGQSTNQSLQASTTVKDLLKSSLGTDPSRPPGTNTQQLYTGNANSMGPRGLSFMNSSSNSSQALSALLGPPSSCVTTPSVAVTNQTSDMSVTHVVEAPPPPTVVVPPTPTVAPPPQAEVTMSQSNVNGPSTTNTDVAVPTQIKIANKMLTLSLTRAQRDKVQSYLDKMSPDQQQQYLQTQQGVLQQIQKRQEMNAQVRAQILAQKKQQALFASQNQVAPGTSTKPQVPDSQIIKKEVTTIPVPNPAVQVTKPTTDGATGVTKGLLSRGLKRNFMDMPRGTLINQQIKQDQNHASKPYTKRPFKSRGDACRRLLRYHVFQSYGPTAAEFAKFDGTMNDVGTELLHKKDKMFDRFRVLLLHETMRSEPSSELVMLQRMQNQDLRKVIEEEKELVASDPDSFVPMPSKFLRKTVSPSKVKKEVVSSDIEEMDTTLVKSEPSDSDTDNKNKMKKLVIKTDGENYRSSFKRKSLESPQSGVEGSLNDSVENVSGDITLHDSQNISNTDDEDTNEFGDDRFQSIHDEAEQAALLISSAEESQDSQTDGEGGSYTGFNINNSSRLSNSVTTNVIPSRNTCELTSESMFYEDDESVVKHSSRPSAYLSGVEGADHYVLNHSPVSNASSDNEVIMDGNPHKLSNLDKFHMYQPITESLTDSEENSHYSADNSTEHNPVIIDDNNGHRKKGSWTTSISKTIEQEASSSDPESDQEVKAQMESAINSILSLGQQAESSDTPSIYSSNHSSHVYSTNSETCYKYAGGNMYQGDVGDMSKGVPGRSEMNPYVVENEDGNASDLELAVNSILM